MNDSQSIEDYIIDYQLGMNPARNDCCIKNAVSKGYKISKNMATRAISCSNRQMIKYIEKNFDYSKLTSEDWVEAIKGIKSTSNEWETENIKKNLLDFRDYFQGMDDVATLLILLGYEDIIDKKTNYAKIANDRVMKQITDDLPPSAGDLVSNSQACGSSYCRPWSNKVALSPKTADLIENYPFHLKVKNDFKVTKNYKSCAYIMPLYMDFLRVKGKTDFLYGMSQSIEIISKTTKTNLADNIVKLTAFCRERIGRLLNGYRDIFQNESGGSANGPRPTYSAYPDALSSGRIDDSRYSSIVQTNESFDSFRAFYSDEVFAVGHDEGSNENQEFLWRALKDIKDRIPEDKKNAILSTFSSLIEAWESYHGIRNYGYNKKDTEAFRRFVFSVNSNIKVSPRYSSYGRIYESLRLFNDNFALLFPSKLDSENPDIGALNTKGFDDIISLVKAIISLSKLFKPEDSAEFEKFKKDVGLIKASLESSYFVTNMKIGYSVFVDNWTQNPSSNAVSVPSFVGCADLFSDERIESYKKKIDDAFSKFGV